MGSVGFLIEENGSGQKERMKGDLRDARGIGCKGAERGIGE
jgi:hypothetical protein